MRDYQWLRFVSVSLQEGRDLFHFPSEIIRGFGHYFPVRGFAFLSARAGCGCSGFVVEVKPKEKSMLAAVPGPVMQMSLHLLINLCHHTLNDFFFFF